MSKKEKMEKNKLTLPILDTEGKAKGEIKLPIKIFGVKASKKLVAQAVHVYLSNQRTAAAKAKTRGEVRGSGKKIWSQKGTGRARHGDRQAPIFKGGGIAHGPTGGQNYHLTIPKKMKKAAVAVVLTSKLEEKRMVIVSGLEEIKPKSKEAMRVIKNVLPEKVWSEREKTLFVLSKKSQPVQRALRNISFISLTLVRDINVYKVISNDWLIFTPEAIADLRPIKVSKQK